MEEKKAKIYNFFRPIYGVRNSFSSLSSGTNSSSARSSVFGFTLIELLVVIGIIGILATAMLLMLNPAEQLQKSRDNRRISDLKVLQSGLELYRSGEGSYPIDTTDGQGSARTVKNCGSSLVDTCSSDDPSTADTVYIQSVPKDPGNDTDYYYCTNTACGAVTSDATTYALYACIESSAIDATGAIGDAPSVVRTRCGAGYSQYILVTNP